MVLSDALTIGVIGVVIGAGVAAALSRLLAGLLFGVTAHDPLTFTVLPPALLAIAALASWIPARRALAVDPMVALRNE
jgi:putative ABC transport system permease protein